MSHKRIKPKIVVICGPTGSGKTTAGIAMAGNFHGRIISADSMQIYRCMNIGTAKPTPDEQASISHYLIDIVDPDETFSAARFATLAGKLIIDLHRQDITPFVVGGTGLYIKALIHGLFKVSPVNTDIRNRLKREAADNGTQALYERLTGYDAAAAARIHPNDTFRIIRALEVYETTGKTISAYQQKHRFENKPFEVLKIGLDVERKALYERIDSRVDEMITSGFVAEVKALRAQGYSERLKAMQSIGYRHIVDFLEGRLVWEEALRTLKRDTRRYAKRQLTWFRRDSDVIWIAPDRLMTMQRLIQKFLQDSS